MKMRSRSRMNVAVGVAAVFVAAGWLYVEAATYALQRGAVMHDLHCPEHGLLRTSG